MNKIELFYKIKSCQECMFKYGETPFFFPMKEQKVMLITACPSIQAMFRPLTSIRFFRTISIALFGDANICPDYIRAIHDEIYWTHMHKCYNEEALKSGNFSKIPDKCMNTYIETEVSLLQPKIIIAFGKVVAERLFKQELSDDMEVLKDTCVECSKWNARVFVTDFPETGVENRFDIVRNVLSEMQCFDFMKRHKDGSWISALSNHEQSIARGLRVNLDFERRTVEQLMLNQTDNSTDNPWLENVVLPNMKNCNTVAKLEFFIEDQVRTMLMEVFSHARNWRIIKDLKNKEFTSKEPLDQNDVYKYLRTGWTRAFKDYFIYLLTKENWNVGLRNGRKLDRYEITDLADKLKELSKIRNFIVHHGCYAPADLSLNGAETKFQGIRWYVNLVYVNGIGIESVKNCVEDIISIITAHDSMRFGQPAS